MTAAALTAARAVGAQSCFQSKGDHRLGGRRLASAGAAVVLALGGAVVTATPAHAGKEGCVYVVGHTQQAGSYITGYRFWSCQNGEIPLPVSVERYLSPGVYETVASGEGEATYYCAGMNYGTFRAGSPGDFPILCT